MLYNMLMLYNIVINRLLSCTSGFVNTAVNMTDNGYLQLLSHLPLSGVSLKVA
jgi:hypothetical protein